MTTKNASNDRRRPERVATRIRSELSAALLRDFTDPRLANLVIAYVHVTDDLSLARVGVVVMGDDASYTRAVAARKVLKRLEGGIRKLMAPRLGMRRVPTFEFEVDRGRTEADRLDALLKEVSDELGKR